VVVGSHKRDVREPFKKEVKVISIRIHEDYDSWNHLHTINMYIQSVLQERTFHQEVFVLLSAGETLKVNDITWCDNWLFVC
jgi:hypothetical protein